MNPVEIIERQLAYYNDHDLEGFCSMYADDVQIHSLSAAEPLVSGKGALRERYRIPFRNPKLHASILSRMSMDTYVIDQELVSGKPEGDLKAGVIYHIEEGLIDKVYFIR